MRQNPEIHHPIPPLMTSDAIGPVDALVRFEYFEVEPGEISAPAAPNHNLLVNFGAQPIMLDHSRNGVAHRIELQPHEIIPTPAGTRTRWKWDKSAKIALIWFDPVLMRRFVETRIGIIPEESGLCEDLVWQDEDIFSIATRLKTVVEEPILGADVLIDALSHALIVVMLQHHTARRVKQGRLSTTDRFREVADFIKDRLSDRISIDDLSQCAGMSRSNFAQAFKAQTGKTPMGFVMEQRLHAARTMLSTSQASIGQIAAQCGFSDQAHLTKNFKIAFGQTPGGFRRAIRASA